MSSDTLFQRAWKVSVDGFATESLRVRFKVEKSTTIKDPNKLDLNITNLSKKSRDLMTAKGMAVILEAGYQGTRSVIFSGGSRICDHKHDAADWDTKIQCGDGERLYQFSRLSKSFGAGYSVADAIRAAADALAVNKGNLDAALDSLGRSLAFDHGFACHGNAAMVFSDLLKSVGLVWSIQQGALLVSKKNAPAIQEVVVLSAATGLLGSPEHSPPNKERKQTTLTCRSLLNPKIRPGLVLRLDSLQVKGDFIPTKVEHMGDSHGQLWETKVEAVASTEKFATVG